MRIALCSCPTNPEGIYERKETTSPSSFLILFSNRLPYVLVHQHHRQSIQQSHTRSCPTGHLPSQQRRPIFIYFPRWSMGKSSIRRKVYQDRKSGDAKFSKERSQRTSFSQCLLMTTDRCAVGHVTIHILPNDVLLELFFVYQKLNPTDRSWWQTLVHVCRRWRGTIFASPLHLRLVLECTAKTPVRKSLNIWPPLPIAIYHDIKGFDEDEDDSIIAALGHRDRVTEIYLTFVFLGKRFAAAMRGPFPALTHLDFGSHIRMVLPEAFLG